MVVCWGDGPFRFTKSCDKSVNTAHDQCMIYGTFRLVRTFERRFQVVQDVPYRLVKSEFSHMPQRSHNARRPVIPQNIPRYGRIYPNRQTPPMVSAMCTERSTCFGQSRVVSKDRPISIGRVRISSPPVAHALHQATHNPSQILPNAPILSSFLSQISHLCTVN